MKHTLVHANAHHTNTCRCMFRHRGTHTHTHISNTAGFLHCNCCSGALQINQPSHPWKGAQTNGLAGCKYTATTLPAQPEDPAGDTAEQVQT